MLTYLELFYICFIFIKNYGYCFYGIYLESPISKSSNSAVQLPLQLYKRYFRISILGVHKCVIREMVQVWILINRNVIGVNEI